MISIPSHSDPLDHDRLKSAVVAANLPSLAMVVYQLTGDLKWLDHPYTPTAGRGLTPHDDGGFDHDIAHEIRAAAIDAITAWYNGDPVAVPAPGGDLLQKMLSVSVGEEVPEEYRRLMSIEMGFESQPEVRPARQPQESSDPDFAVTIIGAGVSGLVAAVKLRAQGIPFVILERNDDVGGVWLTNTYPGCGVDTPSYLYSFSFFPRNWRTHFGKQREMIEYMRDMANHFDLRRDIRFGTAVERAEWDDAANQWTVHATDSTGREVTVKSTALISAVGLFNRANVPNIPGLDAFDGPVAHTAEWPEGLDLTGKRVAVIGTGASAMQVVPAVAETVASLTVFQRSPQWAAPNDEYFAPVSEDVHWLMEHVPFYHQWYRFRLAWIFNDRVHPSLQIDPEWTDPEHSLNAVNAGHRRYFSRYILNEIGDRQDLRDQVVPSYPPFGKRMLLDNGWFAALRRDNVELVTDRVSGVEETSVVAGDRRWDVDAIVLGTGFDVRQYLPGIDVIGKDASSLHEVWGEEDASAHLGITVPGFPNLFLMYGPNTNAGAGGSFIFVAESQSTYIVGLLARMRDDKIAAVECTESALAQWVEEVDRAHQNMVWSHPGMTTYYRNSKGRVVVNSPWRVVDYWAMTREADLADFEVTRRKETAA